MTAHADMHDHDADGLDPVQEIFVAARELGDRDRGAYLDRVCGDDPNRRREVVELLAADTEVAGFGLDEIVDDGVRALFTDFGAEPPEAGAAGGGLADLEGRTIDRYRIGPKLGEGGFAVVHEAEQLAPVRRTVAIKVLKPGMDSRSVLARFDAERQALAVMEHPGIARVLDGGVTDQGRPYFVMERVRGTPITRYADAAHLDVNARLDLFARVCDAVQHAHQKGVVHRDLKPGNILVEDGDHGPRPRVIDFGIAKAIEGPLVDRPAATRHGQLVGTPGYMSPEQILGGERDTDTRADVYALGVLLHELLVGCLPLRPPADATPAELVRLLEGPAPPRPSERLGDDRPDTDAVTRNRGADGATLRRRLRRDLDWVCLTAIDRDRDRRYASVGELAADVRRSLANEVVSTGPPTVGYRLRTFVRRRRVEVVSGTLIVLAIVGASVISTTMAVRASRSLARQTAVSNFLDQFIIAASPFADEAGAGDDGGTRSSILEGRLNDASAMVGVELAAWPEAQAQVRLTLASALHGLGATDRAAEESRAAMTLAAEHIGLDSRLRFDAMGIHSRCLWQMSRTDETIALLEPELERARAALGPDDALTLTLANNLALATRSAGREAEARALHRDTLERRERALGPDHPDTVISRSNYARALQAMGDLDGALELQRSVLSSHERSLGPEHPETLITIDQLGTLLGDLGRLDESVEMHRRAHIGLSQVLGPVHESTLGARFYLSGALARRGQLEEAERELRAIWTICGTEFGPDDRYTTTSLISLADVVTRLGRPEDAAALIEPAFNRAIARSGWTSPQTWAMARVLATADLDRGRIDAAIVTIERIVAEATTSLGPDDVRVVELQLLLAIGRVAAGEDAAARSELERCIDALLAAGKRSSANLPRALEALIRIQTSDGDVDAATRSRAILDDLSAG